MTEEKKKKKRSTSPTRRSTRSPRPRPGPRSDGHVHEIVLSDDELLVVVEALDVLAEQKLGEVYALDHVAPLRLRLQDELLAGLI